MRKNVSVLIVSVLALHAFASTSVQTTPVSPASLGLSQPRLAELTALMHHQVLEEKMVGSVALVARNGKIAYLEAIGKQDREANVPMDTHTIFRIASMTKPIASVAVMMLYDEGVIRLDDRVSKYIPEFENPTVLRPGQTQAVPAKCEITIQHLLTHSSGLTYQWDKHLGPLYRAADITHGIVQDNSVLGDKMKKLARIPLLHDPGEAWTYGLSVDVLGRVVEVASGRSFQEFLSERIFTPLGMKDTHFFIPPDKQKRLATVYAAKPEGGLKRLDSELIVEGSFVYSAAHPYRGKRRYYSGGGGLCSTVTDYWRFAQMLLNKGTLEGHRILKSETVDLMTCDQVATIKKDDGFGLGVSVRRESTGSGAGTFGWGGFWYTTFFVDPGQQLIGIAMGQLHPSGGASLNSKFEGLVRQALVE
jgi:CubicO group peptidase (beta-lactamase class C family)